MPLTLQRLLDTQQATAVLPGILYFATTGECLAASEAATTSASTAAATADDVWERSARTPSSSSSPPSPPPAITAALRDFFVKENPSAGAASFSDAPVPSTCAAVGTDAVFVAPRGTPPYIYRPFFADFGPLDVGCCVLFTRRLTELLGMVAKGAATASTSAAAAAASASRTATAESRCSTAQPAPSDGPAAAAGGASCASPTSSSAAAARPLPVVICASLNAQERVNTACLVGAFCVLALGWSTAATWSRVFADVYPSFLTYRDASTGVSNYPLTLQDVWLGLEQAAQLGWVRADTFDLAAFWEGKENDFSWIVPRRFLAMSSPRDVDPLRTAEVLAQRLRSMNVRLVVRLNDSLYSPAPLLRLGIRHVDLPYPDGSTPNDATLLRFLQAVEHHFGEHLPPSSLRQWWSVPTSTAASGKAANATAAAAASSTASGGRGVPAKVEPHYVACSLLHSGTFRGMPDTRTAVPPRAAEGSSSSTATASLSSAAAASAALAAAGGLGAVAVHCLAGLGRTGTMIAVYMMRHYGFTARGVIGWMRLCRPGSITGVQQQYLDTIERRLRPSPYVFAAQRLKDYVQTLHAARATATTTTTAYAASPSSLSSSTSSLSAVSSGQGGGRDSPRGFDRSAAGAGAEGTLPVEAPWPTPATAAIAAFQTHGNVVGDARPLTGLTGALAPRGHTNRGAAGPSPAAAAAGVVPLLPAAGVYRPRSNSGSANTYAPARETGQLADGGSIWEGGPQGLLLRRTPPPPPPPVQQQQQPRRRSSTSSLSFTNDHPDTTALDAVSSMPLLGGGGGGNMAAATVAGGAERLRGGPGYTSAVSAAATFPGGRFSDSAAGGNTGGGASAGHVQALPRVGDYKYASTYFVALERANRRPPPRSIGNAVNNGNATSNSSGGAGGGGNTPASHTPSRSSVSPGRGRAGHGSGCTATNTIHNNSSIDSTRASTANPNLPQRSGRLDTSPQQQQQQQSHHRRISTGSSVGHDALSRGASFGRRLSLTSQRRVSLMSLLTNGATTAAAAAAAATQEGSSSSAANMISSTTAAAMTAAAGSAHSGPWAADSLLEPRPYTTSAVSHVGPTSAERHSEAKGRLRRTPQQPVQNRHGVRRHLSLHSTPSLMTFPTGESPLPALPTSGGGERRRSHKAHAAAAAAGRSTAPPITAAASGVTMHATGGSRSTSPLERQLRSERIPAALLPLWGRPVGQT